eukprot:4632117-Pyramimonas_sp.AAC.1
MVEKLRLVYASPGATSESPVKWRQFNRVVFDQSCPPRLIGVIWIRGQSKDLPQQLRCRCHRFFPR